MCFLRKGVLCTAKKAPPPHFFWRYTIPLPQATSQAKSISKFIFQKEFKSSAQYVKTPISLPKLGGGGGGGGIRSKLFKKETEKRDSNSVRKQAVNVNFRSFQSSERSSATQETSCSVEISVFSLLSWALTLLDLGRLC